MLAAILASWPGLTGQRMAIAAGPAATGEGASTSIRPHAAGTVSGQRALLAATGSALAALPDTAVQASRESVEPASRRAGDPAEGGATPGGLGLLCALAFAFYIAMRRIS